MHGLEVWNAADLLSVPAPEQRWIVPDLVPLRTTTILSGDGGIGKSTLLLQLAAASATGSEWCGRIVTQGPVLYLGAEDEIEVFHRRLASIAKAPSIIDQRRLADLRLISLAGATQCSQRLTRDC
jgi:RecA-family ATPase